jgi:hypothetical protein
MHVIVGMDLPHGSGDTHTWCNYLKEVIQMSSEILLISDQPLDLNRSLQGSLLFA